MNFGNTWLVRLNCFFLLVIFGFLIPNTGFAQEQPTSMSFSSTSGFAGNSCYTLTIGNSANMTVDLQYQVNGVQYPDGSLTMDANGQWQHCLTHSDEVGTWSFLAMKNHLSADWVPISPAVTYTTNPPQPTSMTFSPSTVTAGQDTYRLTVGNGAGTTLDLQFAVNGYDTLTSIGWPSLVPVSPGSPDGQVDVPVGLCTVPGTYSFSAARNTLNTEWQPLSATITVNPPAAPTAPSITPSSGGPGGSVVVTVSGSNLCNVSLWTNWPGLSFSNVTSNGTSATATFNISSSASIGSAPVVLSASGGSVGFYFGITGNAAPSITGLSPASAVQGTAANVTITGSYLAGAILSTTWSGLTFSNVNSSPDGTSLTATFNVAAGAAAGNPPIQVSTSAGPTITQLFSILQAPALTREYIYFGGRAIAID